MQQGGEGKRSTAAFRKKSCEALTDSSRCAQRVRRCATSLGCCRMQSRIAGDLLQTQPYRPLVTLAATTQPSSLGPLGLAENAKVEKTSSARGERGVRVTRRPAPPTLPLASDRCPVRRQGKHEGPGCISAAQEPGWNTRVPSVRSSIIDAYRWSVNGTRSVASGKLDSGEENLKVALVEMESTLAGVCASLEAHTGVAARQGARRAMERQSSKRSCVGRADNRDCFSFTRAVLEGSTPEPGERLGWQVPKRSSREQQRLSDSSTQRAREPAAQVPGGAARDFLRTAAFMEAVSSDREGSPTKRAASRTREAAPKARSTAGQQEGKELRSLLIMYANALNNMGCLLSRRGQMEVGQRQQSDAPVAVATRQSSAFLRRAQEVERLLFSKPSCSLMLNLSVVLLTAGNVDEAERIAEDCVWTADSGKGPSLLLLVALHNLAVILMEKWRLYQMGSTAKGGELAFVGQDGTARRKRISDCLERAIAVSTQVHGPDDATTVMLRRKKLSFESTKGGNLRAESEQNVPGFTLLTSPHVQNADLVAPQEPAPDWADTLLGADASPLNASQRQPADIAQKAARLPSPPFSRPYEGWHNQRSQNVARSPLPPLMTQTQRERARLALQTLQIGVPHICPTAGASDTSASGGSGEFTPSSAVQSHAGSCSDAIPPTGMSNATSTASADGPHVRASTCGSNDTSVVGNPAAAASGAAPLGGGADLIGGNSSLASPLPPPPTAVGTGNDTKRCDGGRGRSHSEAKLSSSSTELRFGLAQVPGVSREELGIVGREWADKNGSPHYPLLVAEEHAAECSVGCGSSVLLPMPARVEELSGGEAAEFVATVTPPHPSRDPDVCGGCSADDVAGCDTDPQGSPEHDVRPIPQQNTVTDAAGGAMVTATQPPPQQAQQWAEFQRFGVPKPLTISEIREQLFGQREEAAAVRSLKSRSRPVSTPPKAPETRPVASMTGTSPSHSPALKVAGNSSAQECAGDGVAVVGSIWHSERRQCREDVIAAQLEEEEELAKRLQQQAEEAMKQAEFDARRQRVLQTTQTHAAQLIQAVWREWWSLIGAPRKEELERQRKLALARLLDPAVSEVLTHGVDPVARKTRRWLHLQYARATSETGTPLKRLDQSLVASYAVVRCAKRWLEQTFFGRTLVTLGLYSCLKPVAMVVPAAGASTPHALSLSCQVQHDIRTYGWWGPPPHPELGLPPSANEAHVKSQYKSALTIAMELKTLHAQIVRIQSIARRSAAVRLTNTMREADAQRQVELRATDRRLYATIRIQANVRRLLARRLARALWVAKHLGPARLLQAWFRATQYKRRLLGLDKRSQQRRQAAAVVIQKAWLRYAQRLSHAIRQLKLRVNRLREMERYSTGVLQRCGRGYIGRAALGDAWVSYQAEKRSAVAAAASITGAQSQPDLAKTRAQRFRLDQYELDARRRISAVESAMGREREAYHIPLFVETCAARERAALSEALRYRPLDVRRERYHEDDFCVMEVDAMRSERAAVKIQREWRSWLRARRDPQNSQGFLELQRHLYQQKEYGAKVQAEAHRIELQHCTMKFGDDVQPVRQLKSDVNRDLEETLQMVRTRIGVDEVRSRVQRFHDEMTVQQKEQIVARHNPQPPQKPTFLTVKEKRLLQLAGRGDAAVPEQGTGDSVDRCPDHEPAP